MIGTHRAGAVRTITLDRPGSRNALTREGLAALRDVVAAAETPVLYLTGAGEAFCAGADLGVVESLSASTAVEFARQGQAAATALATYDGAVVAGIDGAARGGGVELALACDLRVATPDATFAESGVSLGLFGAWGGTARLPAVVGEGQALDLALSGRVVDAGEAAAMGLVSRVVAEPRGVATTLADHDAAALRTVKRLVRGDADTSSAGDWEAAAFGRLIARRNGGDSSNGEESDHTDDADGSGSNVTPDEESS
jgi:enoyl-CoA hydratase